MTKKEKKADAVLAAAREYCKTVKVERPSVMVIVDKKPAKVMAKVVEPVKPIKAVLPEHITIYDEITIIKKGKGDYRAEVKVNGQKYDIAKKFKSITKAEEWKALHLGKV